MRLGVRLGCWQLVGVCWFGGQKSERGAGERKDEMECAPAGEPVSEGVLGGGDGAGLGSGADWSLMAVRSELLVARAVRGSAAEVKR
jgi:hypothetical protein